MSLNERESAILYAVVSEFIATGEPVGSRTLSNRYGLELSAATIRNVLADLEEKGYLTQPHTSAGRMPTPLAFRLFIDALMRIRRLREEDSERIRELFSSPMGPEARLREAGRLLSELSGNPAVIVRARGEVRRLQRVRFIATKPGELLAVLVFEDSTVENRFIALEGAIDAATLERLHGLLDEGTNGRTLVELSAHLAGLAARASDEIGALGVLGGSLLEGTLVGQKSDPEVIVEGTRTLVDSAENPARLRELMAALDDRKQLVQLLERTAVSTRVEVFLGEERSGERAPFNLVAAGYGREDAGMAGALGVLGPTRMDYPGLVPLVGAMAQALSQELRGGAVGRGTGPETPDPGPSIDRGSTRG